MDTGPGIDRALINSRIDTILHSRAFEMVLQKCAKYIIFILNIPLRLFAKYSATALKRSIRI